MKKHSINYDALALKFLENKTSVNFKTFYKAVKPAIQYHLSKYLIDPLDINDIFNDVITDFYFKVDSISKLSTNSSKKLSPVGWLYNQSKWRALNLLNRKLKFEVGLEQMNELSGIEYDYENLQDITNEYQNSIKEDDKYHEMYLSCISAIKTLPALYVDIACDKFIKGLSNEDIVAKRNVKLSDVKNRLFHCKKIIKDRVTA